jgi:hypothetical protein
MKFIEPWIVNYLLNSIWQVLLVFGAAWLAARLARPADPRMEHRIWICALFVETILPALHINLAGLWRHALALIAWSWGGGAGTGYARITIGPGVVAGTGLLRLPASRDNRGCLRLCAPLLHGTVGGGALENRPHVAWCAASRDDR